MQLLHRLKELENKALDAIRQSSSPESLQEIRVRLLGKKGALTDILKGMGQLPPEERPKAGAAANRLKQVLADSIQERQQELVHDQQKKRLESETIDVTLPTTLPLPGASHPITLVNQEIVRIFHGLGYAVEQGSEVENDYYNFTALNFPPNHPARDMQDTFFLEGGLLLRTHTSPVQIRAMERREPPLKIVVPGVVYRHDADVTHSPVFHQVEGLAVDTDITMADLKGTLTRFAREMFGKGTPVRFRPSFFPFTEPSAEMDMGCPQCKNQRTKKECRVCSSTGWVEILGAGMVDPEVLKQVNYDPEKYQGFAFGMGVERIAMIRYEIDDIRLFFEGSMPFLEQFR